MDRPIIGMTTALVQAKWSVWDNEATLVDSRYVNAVIQAGGLPVLLPPNEGDAGAILARLDGLLLIGGGDVNPEVYGHAVHPQAKPVPLKLDEWNLLLTKAAIKHKLPFFGICRGLQLLNIVCGGTLHQHLPDVVGHKKHAPAPGIRGRHLVEVKKGSLLEPIMGLQPDVVTYHHQAIDRLGEGLEPIAWSDDDDRIIEAVVLAGHPWAVAVQWHAEDDEKPLLKAFVDACAAAPAKLLLAAQKHDTIHPQGRSS